MPMSSRWTALAALALAFVPAASKLTIENGRFMLAGQPLQIISGEMHYPRIPREYWRDRLQKARAMGLNTVSTYVFWNLHEPTPGRYDFAGQNDVAAFARLAGQEGLHVILRPGPYVCAEWELGGYPAWLLADPAMVLRSTDERFTKPAARWLDRLGREIAPLLASRGGPIVAVQVENEYGSFGKDKAYLQWHLDAVRHAGFGDVLLYTADGDVQLPDGTLPGLPAVVNFGTGGAEGSFAKLRAFRPDDPGQAMMSGEYWAGWFDHWGRPHHTTNAAQQTRELTWMLERGYSVNLYMFHGGTTFGFMNGANLDRGRYHPQTSSYDYDAALDESGRRTPKYDAFREVIARTTGAALPPIPATPAPISVAAFPLTPAGSLWDRVTKGVRADRPRGMESFGQSYGYILYRTRVSGPVRGDLTIREVRDYARVYLDGALAGTLDRRLGETTVPLDVRAPESTLDILVENTGRVNFTPAIREERKGITESVTLAGRDLAGWDVVTLPMASTPVVRAQADAGDGPAYYSGTFQLATTGDTFLDTRGWTKGTVWVNGHHLGRFWNIGPQQTLYVPGPWLRRGTNDVVVFTFDRPERLEMQGLAAPLLSLPPSLKE